jgi:hypothetical protein
MLDLSKDISEEYSDDPAYANIFKDMKSLYSNTLNYTGNLDAYGTDRGITGTNNTSNGSKNRAKRLDETRAFWKKYGDILTQ